jgi:hypothetical protein
MILKFSPTLGLQQGRLPDHALAALPLEGSLACRPGGGTTHNQQSTIHNQ